MLQADESTVWPRRSVCTASELAILQQPSALDHRNTPPRRRYPKVQHHFAHVRHTAAGEATASLGDGHGQAATPARGTLVGGGVAWRLAGTRFACQASQ
ncbi:MAG TPA: hypothetical protein VK923_05885 [Euzebyales bacterium]|nr:hypothetical protein [Euzebyales bacterium]